jgi:hypothetical protein
VTQRLKLEPSPISQTRIDKMFSPACECASRSAKIEFVLRRADHLRLVIPIGPNELTLADRDFPRGRVLVHWDGHDRVGDDVPDGVYHAVAHLRREGRTIDLPNPIRVDTVPPTIKLTRLRSNGRKLRINYVASEPAHGVLLVDGTRAVYTYGTRRHGRMTWYGRIKGNPVSAKRHRLALVAVDLAGNRSAPVRIP